MPPNDIIFLIQSTLVFLLYCKYSLLRYMSHIVRRTTDLELHVLRHVFRDGIGPVARVCVTCRGPNPLTEQKYKLIVLTTAPIVSILLHSYILYF